MVGTRNRPVHPLRITCSEVAFTVLQLRASAPRRLGGCRRTAGISGRRMKEVPIRPPSWRARLWSRNAAVLLVRNSAVSVCMFLLGLVGLWLLVEFAHVNALVATAVTFLIATSLHYALARTWVYLGTERRVVPAYGFFVINAMVGLVVTLSLFALLTWL